MISWLIIKAWVDTAWKSFLGFCKDRWELLVGILVGILGVFALTKKDETEALKEFSEISKEERDESLKISAEKSEKIIDAVNRFTEREEEIAESHSDKLENLEKKSEDLKSELLEKERESPGTIASEINKLID